eukprot:snap_masked-scaffold_3-processed-gene-21.63-mRNA-1 protein AED:1.00 eAED:1.00 QI:0/0/0/0/1/1/2/0/398
MNSKYTFVLSYVYLSTTKTLMCFETYFSASDGSCSSNNVCDERCGNFGSGNLQVFPGFVVDENCSSSCLLGEFLFSRPNGDRFRLALPFGCREKYSPNRIENNIASNLLFEEEVNIFSCDTEACNLPPFDTICGLNEAQEYLETGSQQSNCFINNGKFNRLRSHPFRLLNAQGLVPPAGILFNRCVNLNNQEVNELNFRRFNASNSNEQLFFHTCEDCLKSGCDVNEDIPTQQVTFSPVQNETNIPSSSPTQFPSKSPSFPPSRNPTVLNTKSPTKQRQELIFRRFEFLFRVLSLGVFVLFLFLLLIWAFRKRDTNGKVFEGFSIDEFFLSENSSNSMNSGQPQFTTFILRQVPESRMENVADSIDAQREFSRSTLEDFEENQGKDAKLRMDVSIISL